jgi:hypothetical protein
MWKRAATRPGYYAIAVPMLNDDDDVVYKRVNLSQKEYALLDKAVTNQLMAESKPKVFRAVVYQRNLQLWDDGMEDAVAMRVLAPWAVAHYKCQPQRFLKNRFAGAIMYILRLIIWFIRFILWFGFGYSEYQNMPRLWNEVDHRTYLLRIETAEYKLFKWIRKSAWAPVSSSRNKVLTTLLVMLFLFMRFGSVYWAMLDFGLITMVALTPVPKDSSKERITSADDDAREEEEQEEEEDEPEVETKNSLGYQKPGIEYVNTHPGGGKDDEDSEIRATVQGRIIRKDCGVGVVGQSVDDLGKKQIVGVLSQPISVEPNVYAQELNNAIKAIEERINKKQRPYAGTKADELKIKRMVSQSIIGKRNAPFSAKKILDLIHELVYENVKSKKWTENRVNDAIESLCREIDPQFKLKAAVKLEPMPEEKAPRLLIADEDRGQVMALMTIYCIETLIKRHFPEKGIKGLPKKEAIKRVMKACRVPRKAAKKMVTIFEGDGSAWDTTCSASVRDLVENPVINHVAKFVNAFMYATPASWAEAHESICSVEKLDLSYAKNKEYQRITIDAIRRSGHRGTSTLNWWVNFVCWHCAIFEDPELFLDPTHRYGKDVTGVSRWLNSAFEGDDSFLVTSPAIEPGKQLHSQILQFWERIGFNMKIEIRKDRALFVGYYIGLDDCGPLFDEKKNEWMMVPEIDRCFQRAGTSCSASTIEAFKAGDREKCVRLAGSAAMSRAFEYAGLAPTISNKFLQYAVDCDFELTHDLRMRTHEEFDDKSELIDHIRSLNGTCQIEDKILTSTGFWASDAEKNRFVDWLWDYDQLFDWDGFRTSLPASWRA